MSTDSLLLIEIAFQKFHKVLCFLDHPFWLLFFWLPPEGWLLKYYGLIDRSNEIFLLPLPEEVTSKLVFFQPNPNSSSPSLSASQSPKHLLRMVVFSELFKLSTSLSLI